MKFYNTKERGFFNSWRSHSTKDFPPSNPVSARMSWNVKQFGKTETFLDALLSLKTGFSTGSGFWWPLRPRVD
jgi:hypothetical protein